MIGVVLCSEKVLQFRFQRMLSTNARVVASCMMISVLPSIDKVGLHSRFQTGLSRKSVWRSYDV